MFRKTRVQFRKMKVQKNLSRLKDEHFQERARAAKALGKLGDSSAVEPLLKALDTERSESVVAAIVAALGNLGDTRAVEILLELLAVARTPARCAAAAEHKRMLQKKGLREYAKLLLVNSYTSETLPAILEARSDDGKPLLNASQVPAVMHYALEYAQMTGEVDRMMADVQTAINATLWCNAASSLARLGDGRAVAPIQQGLQDENSLVRDATAKALAVLLPKALPSRKETVPAVSTTEESGQIETFEVPVEVEVGRCSDSQCPCVNTEIHRGTGYLYISKELVEFRRRCPTMTELRTVLEQMKRTIGASVAFVGTETVYPIMMCRQGAELRGIDLAVAADDAKNWWSTGRVPLRPTPLLQAFGKEG